MTILDIAVVESYYRPIQAWNSIWVWHLLYRTVFIVTPVIASYFMKSLIPLATWFFFLFGLEDTLFYAMQGYLPPLYYGVNVLWFWEPSVTMVLQMNLVGLAAILVFGFVTYKKQASIQYHAKTLSYRLQQPIHAIFRR
ncbi:MAG: hypothetical protein WC325_05195 [Candidatus Bathyarchaeia archaeon]